MVNIDLSEVMGYTGMRSSVCLFLSVDAKFCSILVL